MNKDLEVSFKDEQVGFNYHNVIWNTYTKKDLDRENTLTDEEWLQFVAQQAPNLIVLPSLTELHLVDWSGVLPAPNQKKQASL